MIERRIEGVLDVDGVLVVEVETEGALVVEVDQTKEGLVVEAMEEEAVGGIKVVVAAIEMNLLIITHQAGAKGQTVLARDGEGTKAEEVGTMAVRTIGRVGTLADGVTRAPVGTSLM